ncbi:class I SAM-dependent methyltransferase [Mucilaginibacter sp. SMC90]|uniref:methyltransferase domain-containing protein n=1 Tax=Mucilaginibacter TaxID=423349 RepID=UPI00131E0788|nr:MULTISPECIES: class I SAM-dependent methyltransferase [unclassified Mucilaginibacter]MBS7565682.1 class I SAM-dependent methyltransferase [Mucilaginibacter sp. Bleaf8]UOE49856.1 class I SAM-dependent methyltransferase [Mucilaginibacter sp. SMC90]
MANKKDHWENVYAHKKLTEVSWYEEKPETSLSIINSFDLPKDAAIIDIGGGDSLLADHLLELGYSNITVLDISTKAIDRAKLRLGYRANEIKWIVSDVLDIGTDDQYDIWHDRAAFHFLTNTADQSKYAEVAAKHLTNKGWLIIGTFGISGPERCSGLAVERHSPASLSNIFQQQFQLTGSVEHIHHTPFNTEQLFNYIWFQNFP